MSKFIDDTNLMILTRLITNASWFITNKDLHAYFKIAKIKDEIKKFSIILEMTELSVLKPSIRIKVKLDELSVIFAKIFLKME